MTQFTPPYPEGPKDSEGPQSPYQAQPYLHPEYFNDGSAPQAPAPHAPGQSNGASQPYGGGQPYGPGQPTLNTGQQYPPQGYAPMYPYGPGGVLPRPTKQSKAWIWWLVGICGITFLAFITAIVFFAVTDTDLTAKETAYAYNQAWDDANCDAYGDLTTANLRAEDQVDSCAELSTRSKQWRQDYPGVKFEVNSISVEGSSAIANVTFTPASGPAFKQAWELIKINGTWVLDSFGTSGGSPSGDVDGSATPEPEPDPI